MVVDRGIEASILPWLLSLIGLSMGVNTVWRDMLKHDLDVLMASVSARPQPIHEIRLAAHAALKRWGIQDDNYKNMYKLLGYDVDEQWPIEMTDRDINILKMLAGPHGYAVYKALLARMKDG